MPYFATHDGVDIYYEQRGSGSPLLLVHGYAANRRFFAEQLESLTEAHRIISFDLRGHGDSEPTEHGLRLPQYADDLRQLVRHLELESFDVLAWAMGGKVVLDYIDQFSDEDIRKLCLIETTPKTISGEEWEGRTESYDYEDNLKNLQSMVRDWEGYVERFYVPYLFSPDFEEKNPDRFEWVTDQAKQNVPHVMINTWISSSAQDYRLVLPEISVPCLLARGEKSQLYEPAIADYMAEKITHARVVVFQNAGHALQLEVPEEFNERLLNFFA